MKIKIMKKMIAIMCASSISASCVSTTVGAFDEQEIENQREAARAVAAAYLNPDEEAKDDAREEDIELSIAMQEMYDQADKEKKVGKIQAAFRGFEARKKFKRQELLKKVVDRKDQQEKGLESAKLHKWNGIAKKEQLNDNAKRIQNFCKGIVEKQRKKKELAKNWFGAQQWEDIANKYRNKKLAENLAEVENKFQKQDLLKMMEDLKQNREAQKRAQKNWKEEAKV